jgi:hypothetical protein
MASPRSCSDCARPVGVVWGGGDEGARLLQRLGTSPGLDQREYQVVGGLLRIRAGGQRPLEGVDGGIERAQALERLAQPILHVGIERRRDQRPARAGRVRPGRSLCLGSTARA